MERNYVHGSSDKVFLGITVAMFFIVLLMVIISIPINSDTNMYLFSEQPTVLNDGWTITDTEGATKGIVFPATIDYGKNGKYTLRTTVPESYVATNPSVLSFYSNYVDLAIYIDDELIYNYPYSASIYTPGTGNTWHYVNVDKLQGRNLKICIECQLGDDITYLLDAPQLGSMSLMLNATIKNSIFSLIVVCVMFVISIILFVMYFTFKHQLRTDTSSLYLALFSITYACYVLLETPYIKLTIPNSYATYTCTFIALALMPVPLIGVFNNAVSEKRRVSGHILMMLCITNLLVQAILHFCNISNFRTMLIATHTVIIIVMLLTLLNLLVSSRKKQARISVIRLIASLPMILGGLADITLIWIERPSFNNGFWFMLGVLTFVIALFIDFILKYFSTYRLAIEGEFLRTMAYHDELSGLGNRNAYEKHIKELSTRLNLSTIGCIVADIDNLKQINDTQGHQAGDRAIAHTGRIILSLLPDFCKAYRTGGDEFIIVFDTMGITDEMLKSFTETLKESLHNDIGDNTSTYELSFGFGCMNESDKDIYSFISRIDTLMYTDKASKR